MAAENTNKNKALIAMSGGVDSSVAALLMQEKGYECMGATMHLFDNTDLGMEKESTCCSLSDVEDARMVAGLLDMPFYVFNYKDIFREKVIGNFVCEYQKANTPNPCIDCNKHLKFNTFHKRAMELGCNTVVTGHYARVEYNESNGRYLLKCGVDKSKDQSYVLYGIPQDVLAHTQFPLGGLLKDEVRAIAEKHGFVNARKKDSQDICFVPDGNYAEFIESYTGKTYPEGDFTDTDGKVLGRHKGIIRYTVGQRKGLGLALNEPMYVKEVNIKDNTVVLARDEELFSSELTARNINLISVDKITEPMEVMAKIRYRHTPAKAVVTQTDEDEIKVVFSEPQRAITKGQAVVLYDGDVVVGGGTIV